MPLFISTAAYPQFALVLLHDSLAYPQAQPGTLAYTLQCEKGFAEAGQGGFVHAMPSIANRQADIVTR